MTDHEPTDTTLTDVFAADQAATEIEATAGRIAGFYERLAASGMRGKTAEAITREYATMLTSSHFGVDVPSTFGISVMEGDV